MSETTSSARHGDITEPGTTILLEDDFPSALEGTKAALKAEGFGVLSEIDLRAAFREKLDREFRPYVILGACNPPLAWKAVSAAPDVGLLLPCNVTVEENPGGGSTVRLVNPEVMLSAGALAERPELREVAAEAGERLQRVARRLRGEAG